MNNLVLLLESRIIQKTCQKKNVRNIQNKLEYFGCKNILTNFLFSMSASFLLQVSQCTGDHPGILVGVVGTWVSGLDTAPHALIPGLYIPTLN